MVFLQQYAERKMLIRCSEIYEVVIRISHTNGAPSFIFNNNQSIAFVNLPLFVSGSHSNCPSPVTLILFPGLEKGYQSFTLIPVAAKWDYFFSMNTRYNEATKSSHHRYYIHVYNVYHSNQTDVDEQIFCAHYISLPNSYINLLT